MPSIPRLFPKIPAALGVLVIAVLGFGFHSAAATAAPFDPAIDQYAEHVPGPGGQDPVQGADPRPPAKLPRGTREVIATSEDGAALERMIRRTAPIPASSDNVDARAEVGDGSGSGAILGELGGSAEGGLGPLFILLMIVFAVLIAGGAFLRTASRRSLGQ